MFDETAAHVVRHDPERVLADCVAKRAMVEHAENWAQTLHETPEGWSSDGATVYRMAMEWTLGLMVTAYADHPDYRSEWAS